MHTTTISSLAGSRVSYYKSRSILTVIAIMLTTALLAGLVTGGLGVFDITRQQAAAEGNYHAIFKELSAKQVEQLNLHLGVESLQAFCSFAAVTYDGMNGFLSYRTTYKEGIYQSTGSVAEGRLPEAPDEICAPPSFFERMGAEPAIGNKVTIPFRVGGKGQIQTRDFTICGLMTQIDLSGMEISDSRIVYSALISEALADEYLSPEDRTYNALVRVFGESSLHYDEITDRIKETAADIGCDELYISFHTQYLTTMTDLSMQTALAVLFIGLIVLFFSALVIYSIYYVSVITDVQELGKLKALGASAKQVKKLLISESMRLAAIAIPPGLLLGFLIPAAGLPLVMKYISEKIPTVSSIRQIQMFSPLALTVVVIFVLLAIRISLQKPLRMAGKISPMEAIRYQESSAKGSVRKGCRNVGLLQLSCANLLRHKKRTFVTILAMGLSCVLFISLSAILSSMDPEDIARVHLSRGDFCLALACSWNDKEYPENNFDTLQQENLFNDDLIRKIENIDGVTNVERAGYILAGGDPSIPFFAESPKKSLSPFSQEDGKTLQKAVLYGEIDYDRMLDENGVIFTADLLWKDSGLAIGDVLSFTLYDGDRQIPFTATISAVIKSENDYDYFLLPEEIWEELDLQYDTTSDLYIDAEPAKYNTVKDALQEITAGQEHFDLYSIDEEIALGRMSIILLKLPAYVILIMTAVISCINLINTMITSIVTRKRELGVLQALGLSGRQLKQMLSGEGLFFTAGTLLTALTVGNLFGYLSFLWAKAHYISGVKTYHYPFWETVGLTVLLVIGQLLITGIMNKRLQQESLIDRIRSGE